MNTHPRNKQLDYVIEKLGNERRCRHFIDSYYDHLSELTTLHYRYLGRRMATIAALVIANLVASALCYSSEVVIFLHLVFATSCFVYELMTNTTKALNGPKIISMIEYYHEYYEENR
jgi:hypothetical protein